MNKNESLETKAVILHDSYENKIRVKDWIEIQLSLHKRKESASQWLNDLKIAFNLYKRLLDLNKAEWIGLQYLIASLNDPCIIYDLYDRYTMEEVIFINRIVKKIADQKLVQIFSEDNRILYRKGPSNSVIKISMSCHNFNAQKYMRVADIHQEGDNLICYFENKEKAMRFVIKCLNQEDVYYLEIEEYNEKTCI